MPIVSIIAILLIVVGLIGVVAVFAIPGWRLRGPRRAVAIGRLIAFLLCLAIGIVVLVYGELSAPVVIRR